MIGRLHPDTILTGRDYNRISEEFHSSRIHESPSIRPRYQGSGLLLEAKSVAPVSVNPWHPFRIYQISGTAPDAENDYRRFRVRSGRVGLVGATALANSDRVQYPYLDPAPAASNGSIKTFTIPGGVGRYWFWVEIGDGAATVMAQELSDPLNPVSAKITLPTEVSVGGDFVNIHPRYRPIGYVENTQIDPLTFHICQQRTTDMTGPMINLCWEGIPVGFPTPVC